MPGYWLWWHTGDGIGPTQPSPAQPSQPRQAAEDGDMQHTATADNLMLGTLRYLQRHRGSSALTRRSIPSPGRVLSSLSLSPHPASRWFQWRCLHYLSPSLWWPHTSAATTHCQLSAARPETSAANEPSAAICFHNHGEGPTRAFSRVKAPTSVFTYKTLLRHYAKQALTHGKWT